MHVLYQSDERSALLLLHCNSNSKGDDVDDGGSELEKNTIS